MSLSEELSPSDRVKLYARGAKAGGRARGGARGRARGSHPKLMGASR